MQPLPAPAAPSTIRSLRELAKVSIRDLEAATGINRGRLSIIERGVQPTPDELAKILGVIGPKPRRRSARKP